MPRDLRYIAFSLDQSIKICRITYNIGSVRLLQNLKTIQSSRYRINKEFLKEYEMKYLPIHFSSSI
nr:MAG TPA: hypothetical protein [Caudoviricetes sp.]